MPLQFFKVRVNDPGPEQARLNAFLNSHRILQVRQEFCTGEDPAWAVSVDYMEGVTNSRRSGEAVGKTGRIDYREVLDASDFILYAKLRDLRKSLSESEGVPLFTIFTNEQLAAMVQAKCRVLADLKSIAGIGEGRVSKYGETFLNALENAPPAPAE